MCKLLILITVCTLPGNFCFSQPVFHKRYNDFPVLNETNRSQGKVMQTKDGGYIVSGTTAGLDIYLIKTDAGGNNLWSKTYGGLGDDYASSVQETYDGGYIIAGRTNSFGGVQNIYVIKTNFLGDTLWTKTYGSGWEEDAFCIRQTIDTCFVITGYTTSYGQGGWDICLMKIDSYGNFLWANSYGGFSADFGKSVEQTEDNGFIITGRTANFGPATGGAYNVYLIKTDAVGGIMWTKTYGQLSSSGLSVKQTSDRGYILTGSWTNPTGLSGALLIKTDSLGDTLWTKFYTDTVNGKKFAAGYSIIVANDSGYVIAGYKTGMSPNWIQDYFLFKTDVSGNLIWAHAYGGGGNDEIVTSISQSMDGGFILSGYEDIASLQYLNILKTDANGTVGCNELPINLVALNTDMAMSSGGILDTAAFTTFNTNTIVTDITPADTFLCYTCTAPTAGFSHADSLLSVSFTDASTYATAWSWDFGDGNTDTVQNPAHAYAADGAYEVCLIASNICGSDTVCDSVIVTSVGIGNAENQQVFVHAYPNPFSNKTSIAFSVPESSRVKLNVFNISGGVVATLFDEDAEKGKTYNLEFNSTGLPGGVYFYNLLTDEGSYTNKLVIIKQ